MSKVYSSLIDFTVINVNYVKSIAWIAWGTDISSLSEYCQPNKGFVKNRSKLRNLSYWLDVINSKNVEVDYSSKIAPTHILKIPLPPIKNIGFKLANRVKIPFIKTKTLPKNPKIDQQKKKNTNTKPKTTRNSLTRQPFSMPMIIIILPVYSDVILLLVVVVICSK